MSVTDEAVVLGIDFLILRLKGGRSGRTFKIILPFSCAAQTRYGNMADAMVELDIVHARNCGIRRLQ